MMGHELATVLLAASCSGPDLSCKREVAKAVDIFIWLMAVAAGFVGAWNLLMPHFGAGDSADDMAATITRAGMYFRFMRRVLPTFITFLLFVLILDVAHSRVTAWAGG